MASKEELEAMGIEQNIIICENCYEENEATRTNCKKCGAKLYKNGSSNNYKTSNNKTNSNFTYTENSTAKAVKVIGWIEIICGIILGIVLGNVNTIGRSFNAGICIGTIVAGIITGIFILGFGEIIQKLQNIEDNTRK